MLYAMVGIYCMQWLVYTVCLRWYILYATAVTCWYTLCCGWYIQYTMDGTHYAMVGAYYMP